MTDGKIPETADRFRHGNPGALFELRTAGEGVEILRGVGAGDPGEHVPGEFVRAGRGNQNGGRCVVLCSPVLPEHIAGHGGMGIEQIMVLMETGPDFRQRGIIVGASAPENVLQPFPALVSHAVGAAFLQEIHPGFHQRAVPVCHLEEQALQIAGDQDIHAGALRFEEDPMRRIDAGAEEIGQDIVAVAGADELPDREPHFPGVIGSQNVAEIPGRDAEIHGIPAADSSLRDQIRVG